MPQTWPALSQPTISNYYMNLTTNRKLCLVTAEIRPSARCPADAVRNELSTKPAWTLAEKTWITLVCARLNSKHATTFTCSRSDTARRARRLNFQNTSRHTRTLVRILSTHGKSFARPNHTTMEVHNAMFCLAEKYILTASTTTTLNKRTELVNKCRH